MTSSQTPSTAKPLRNSHNDSNQTSPRKVQLIYAGGTFGSYGKPLAALPAHTFLPLLIDHIHHNISPNVAVLPNSCVKDSSQFSPADLAHFFKLIVESYADGNRQFLLITGTDTLSYLGSFLAEAFAGSDLCLVLTASMKPLFDPNDIRGFTINSHSDAWENLSDALGLAAHGDPGVSISFAGESWPAQTVQKIHSHDLMAFTGHHRAGYPANSYDKLLHPARRKVWIEDALAKVDNIVTNAQSAIIATIYCVPNEADWLATQLTGLLTLPATGIILIGFGAGNMPYNEHLAATLDKLYQHGHLIICTTQCPFGGVSDAYAAGSWQYEHQVLSAGRLTISAVYARLLWLRLAYDSPARRRQRWSYSVSK